MRAGLRASTAAIGSRGDDLGRHVVVEQRVHEGGVGAVLQQAAHQIGQQVLVAADRRVDAQRHVAPSAPRPPRSSASPMPCSRWRSTAHAAPLGQPPHRRQGVGVVGGELAR